ncbi:hemophilus-specific protein [Pasteurella multocida]
MQKKLNVKILLSAIGDKMPKTWKTKPDFISSLKKRALESWNSKSEDANSVRFLYRLPSNNGFHFRFFTVTEQEDGSLLVSKGGSNE